MTDRGHELTDRIIEGAEREVEKVYRQAAKEVGEKYEKYMADFARKDAKKKAAVEAGTLSQAKYDEWKKGQLLIGERWKEMRDTLAEDMVHADSIARSIYIKHMPEVYALNHNYATFQVERDSLVDTSYTLYNRRAVENLLRKHARLLPYPAKDSETAKMLREHKDLVWNQTKINSALTQGILQGESNPQIAKRLMKVVGMNESAAKRSGRTMMTGVENKARQDAYDDLRKKGIKLREKWIATLDSRTRHSHRMLHGTYKDEDGYYKNDLRYPGDPDGDPEEVYNCRCCEIAEVEDFTIDAPRYSPKIKGISFEDWQAAGSGRAKWLENED